MKTWECSSVVVECLFSLFEGLGSRLRTAKNTIHTHTHKGVLGLHVFY